MKHDSLKRPCGGSLLRRVRKAQGLTLQQAADDLLRCWGSGDVGHLSRIESGQIVQPAYETLAVYLTVLKASYGERCAIFEAFGYVPDHPLPSLEELDAAQEACRTLVDSWPAPAYMLDPWHRFVHWNPFFPRVLNRHPDSFSMQRLRYCSLIEAVFDPSYQIWDVIANRAVFIPQMIHLMRREGENYIQEAWYQTKLSEALTQCSAFYTAWEKHKGEDFTATQRTIVPLRVCVQKNILSFRFLTDVWEKDARFRIVHYIAADIPTQQTLQAWMTTM